MATFIDTKIIISKPVRQKAFGYYVTIDRKSPEHLTIKAHDSKGRSKGVAGSISKKGYISMNKRHMPKLSPLINTKPVQAKIELTLDLLYGLNRLRMCTLNDKGLADFHPSISLIDTPRNNNKHFRTK